MLIKMIEAGMDCVRLNFSHGTQDEHRALFQRVKKLSTHYNHQVAIMCDIQGPKIRTVRLHVWFFLNRQGRMLKPFTIKPEDEIDVTPHEIAGTPEAIQVGIGVRDSQLRSNTQRC
jgi:pyruvate kinase